MYIDTHTKKAMEESIVIYLIKHITLIMILWRQYSQILFTSILKKIVWMRFYFFIFRVG